MLSLSIKIFIASIIGYLLGSVNTSIIVSYLYKTDIRLHGSKNAGMTNTLRTLGKFAAFLVIIGDILKGVLSCIIGFYLTKDNIYVQDIGLMAAGVFAIVGHNWPLYFGFKGGKGILTSFSVIIMMNWKIAILLFGVFLIIVVITRYISLGSIVASILFPIMGLIIINDIAFFIFSCIIAMLAVIRHIPNIKRLTNGTELKFRSKKANESNTLNA